MITPTPASPLMFEGHSCPSSNTIRDCVHPDLSRWRQEPPQGERVRKHIYNVLYLASSVPGKVGMELNRAREMIGPKRLDQRFCHSSNGMLRIIDLELDLQLGDSLMGELAVRAIAQSDGIPAWSEIGENIVTP